MCARAPRRRRRSPSRRATVAVGSARTKRARSARGLPRRRSWNSSAAPTNAGSVPATERAPSGPWSPMTCSAAHAVQRPPRRRARTCASARLPRAQRRPIRSKRRGARSTRVVRHPAPAADAASGSRARSISKTPSPPTRAASAEAGERSDAAANAAAPSPRTWRRVERRSGTVTNNTGEAEKARSGAVRTGTVQDDVVGTHVVAEPLAEPVDQPLELRVGERVLLPAAVADRVMVVLAARVGGLEAGDPADVYPVHQPELGERVEGAVDAREPDAAAAAGAVPRAGEFLAGVVGPGRHASRMVTRIVFSMVIAMRIFLLLPVPPAR